MTRAFAALGLLLAIVTFTPLLGWWTSALSTEWGAAEGDILIVPGGDMAGADTIGLSSYWRSVYTATEWREHHYRTILITGKGIAPLMRDFVAGLGVPATAITVEDAAVSTRESAVIVAGMLSHEPGRKVLLTSDYHSRRAQLAFRRAGLEVSAIPIPDVRKRLEDRMQRWPLAGALMVETAKYIWYKAHGWL